MKYNKVTELLLKECPKCGALASGNDKECQNCGAVLAKLQWIPVDVDDTEQADVLAANREVAARYADRSADIISKAFPGIKIPPKEEDEENKTRWNGLAGYYLGQTIGSSLVLIGAIGKDNPVLFWLILVGLFVLVSSGCIWYYIQKQDKAERALGSGETRKALIVSVGGLVVQYQQRFRRMKVLTDMDGRAVIVEALVNYVPDEMCDTFYPIGKEVSLVGKNDYYAVLLEN
ncbi:MAG: hypothetical protein J5649_08305 [Lachnospiraceae bacterium]|nr:hypothetical protein [Lachnospiraceae bacterium]